MLEGYLDTELSLNLDYLPTYRSTPILPLPEEEGKDIQIAYQVTKKITDLLFVNREGADEL